MAKLLIKNAEIISAKDTDKYYIGIEDNLIKVISKELPQEFESAEVIDADGKIAVPGMVNTHTHAAMTLLRSYHARRYDAFAQLCGRHGADGLAAK